MGRIVQINKSVAERFRRLGLLGELLAESILERAGFRNIRNLNYCRKNFPYADIYAERGNAKYVISVKTRNKYERTGKLNRRYKLGARCYEYAAFLEEEFKATAAWVAISIDSETYSVYFGLLSELHGKLGIDMSEPAVLRYECLAKDEPHTYNYSDIQNTY